MCKASEKRNAAYKPRRQEGICPICNRAYPRHVALGADLFKFLILCMALSLALCTCKASNDRATPKHSEAELTEAPNIQSGQPEAEEITASEAEAIALNALGLKRAEVVDIFSGKNKKSWSVTVQWENILGAHSVVYIAFDGKVIAIMGGY